MLEQGSKLVGVQHPLGHRNVGTTSAYLRPTESAVEAVLRAMKTQA